MMPFGNQHLGSFRRSLGGRAPLRPQAGRARVGILLAALALGVSGALVPEVATASEAERIRLVDNMKNLAEKNAWTGVERVYGELQALGVDLSFETHMLGAEAARNQGKTFEQFNRLQRALAVEGDDTVQQSVDAIESQYGRVEIVGKERWSPILVRQGAMPFAPDQRRSIEYAVEHLGGAGSFKGMLPSGTYTIGEQTFEVAPGADWTVVELTKKDLFDASGVASGGGEGGDAAPPPRPSGTDGVIIYAGPVALGGFNFASSGAPGSMEDPIMSEDNPNYSIIQPQAFSASGLNAHLGGEIGLTYEFGVAATVAYQGGYGTQNLQQIDGWLAGAFRPGDLRFAFGPTWGYLAGGGKGLADWVQVGQSTDIDNGDIHYKGQAFAGGLALSGGYGILDIGSKLQGMVELGGGWKTDGTRSYVNAGLRFGIVPKVPRYSE